MKDKQIHIRLTKDDYDYLKQRSQKANLTMTDYMMKSALNKKIVVIVGYKEIFNEIRKIGININQIARKCNMGLIQQSDIEEIQTYMEQIWQLLRYSQEKII